MRCKACNYPLWNLVGRQCPECGAPFAPSEFEFVTHSVAYCCPHCDQTYYGTGEHGHLEPPEFDCVSCGTHVQMDEMVLRPTEGLQEQQTHRGDMPWFDRKTRGRAKAWFATIWLAMMHPATLMRGVPDNAGIGEALWFAIVTNSIFMLGRMIPLLCFVPFMFAGANSGNSGMGASTILAILGGGTVVGVVGTLIVILVSIGLWGLTSHAVLAMTGSRAAGMGRTFEAVCYSSGANAITVVPCIGDFSFIWWIISGSVMLREGQKVSGVRATFAMLALPLTITVLLVALYAGMIAVAVGATNTASTAAATAQSVAIRATEAATIGQRLTLYAAARSGAPPAHALDLVPESGSAPGLFISSSTATGPDDVPVNEGTLRDFQRLGPNRQRAAAQTAAAALPDDVIAHRVGDFVFTWHGINIQTADPALWLAVSSPDPGVNPESDSPLVAILVSGRTQTIPIGSLEATLRQQNAVRLASGLAPLPDPATVTHESPAAGGR